MLCPAVADKEQLHDPPTATSKHSPCVHLLLQGFINSSTTTALYIFSPKDETSSLSPKIVFRPYFLLLMFTKALLIHV